MKKIHPLAHRLTDPQRRMLNRIKREGCVHFNGRAERTLKVLRDKGLICLTCKVKPDALRGRHSLIWIAWDRWNDDFRDPSPVY